MIDTIIDFSHYILKYDDLYKYFEDDNSNTAPIQFSCL